jgi:hypothetical protein
MSEKIINHTASNIKASNIILNEKSVKRHIKRLGKMLQDNPDIELKKTLSHTQLQEMFAQTLGFNNYHELHEVLKASSLIENQDKNKASVSQPKDDYRLPQGKIITEINGKPLEDVLKKARMKELLTFEGLLSNKDILPYECTWHTLPLNTEKLIAPNWMLILILLQMSASKDKEIQKLNIFSHFVVKQNLNTLLGFTANLKPESDIFGNEVFTKGFIKAIRHVQDTTGETPVYELHHYAPLMQKYHDKLIRLSELAYPVMHNAHQPKW